MSLGERLRDSRLKAGLTEGEAEDKLILGAGWIRQFESGQSEPSLGLLAEIAQTYETTLSGILEGMTPQAAPGTVSASQVQGATRIHFDFGAHRAEYDLIGVAFAEYEKFLHEFRESMASSLISHGLVTAFLSAIGRWPHLNPSDLWYFLINRLYHDRYNHPAASASTKDMAQSWKRASGWALERVLVEHYTSRLTKHEIELLPESSDDDRRAEVASKISAEVDLKKIDLLVVAGDEPIGIVNVKASFAERRNADEAMSKALIAKGYSSSFVTMDCKATPSRHPVNKGELGEALIHESGISQPKRSEIEVGRIFDACFSFNTNTIPTPSGNAAARIHVVDFSTNDDAFTQHLVDARNRRLGS